MDIHEDLLFASQLIFSLLNLSLPFSLSHDFKIAIIQVVSEYRNQGMEFILQAINYPTFLEDVTGLTELMKSATSLSLDWDKEIDEEEDCVDIQ